MSKYLLRYQRCRLYKTTQSFLQKLYSQNIIPSKTLLKVLKNKGHMLEYKGEIYQ